MQGILAPLLRTAVRKYLRDRFQDRFSSDDYERLAKEFLAETTSDEFSELRRADSEQRRDLIRTISLRIQSRFRKNGTKEEKALMRAFAKARSETSTRSGRGKGRRKAAKRS